MNHITHNRTKDNKDVLTIQEGKWDDRATDWQLDVERWVIDDKGAGELARKAFTSHVRAYATHVVAERGIFDVKGLHLGHLAKAFALRERPGHMGRGHGNANTNGRRPPQGERRRVSEGEANRNDGKAQRGDDDRLGGGGDEGQDAARKMRKKMREQAAAGASEFNIG